MPIFQLLDLERMLIYQNFFYEKVLFTTQLSSHLMRKLLKKSWMVSNIQGFWIKSFETAVLFQNSFVRHNHCMSLSMRNFFFYPYLVQMWSLFTNSVHYFGIWAMMLSCQTTNIKGWDYNWVQWGTVQIRTKTLNENWDSKATSVGTLLACLEITAKIIYFLGIKLFLFFKIESWNF